MRWRIVGCLLAAMGMLVLPGAVMAQCQSCSGAAACAIVGVCIVWVRGGFVRRRAPRKP